MRIELIRKLESCVPCFKPSMPRSHLHLMDAISIVCRCFSYIYFAFSVSNFRCPVSRGFPVHLEASDFQAINKVSPRTQFIYPPFVSSCPSSYPLALYIRGTPFSRVPCKLLSVLCHSIPACRASSVAASLCLQSGEYI